MPKPVKSEGAEVVAASRNDRPQRRRFSAEQKARILEEADRCERGQLGQLLRREGIYASQLGNWRAQREQSGLTGLTGLAGCKPGPKSTKDAKDHLIDKQQKHIKKLEKELRISKALIVMQEKAHEILGIALPRIEENDAGTSSHLSSSARKRFQ
jgi:transposase